MNRTTEEENRSPRYFYLSAMIIGVGLIFYGIVIVPPHVLYHFPQISWAGVALTALGLLFAAWARFHLGRYWSGTITLKEGHRLIRSGPYRFVRHPIYTGILTAVLGSTLCAGSFEAIVGFNIVFLALVLKIVREELFLQKHFGEEYEQFREQVSAVIPYIF